MGHKAGQCKTSTPQDIFIVTPSLEGWLDTFSSRGKAGSTGHQPSILMSWG